MKLVLVQLLLLGTFSFLNNGLFVVADAQIPTQTFIIPLPEKDVFDQTFKRINSGDTSGPVTSIIAISISTSNTIVWYDHHEDGYDDAGGYRNASSLSRTTQIWGDGNCANGFAFGTTCRSPADDVLKAGQSIVIENEVNVASGANNGFKYDGGDKVLASYPIAITRGAYPKNPGSLMAGGVEVLDTSEWGTFYVAPVGQDVSTPQQAFEHTSLYVMAKDDNTTLNFSDGKNYTLNCGDSITHIVKTTGLTLTASAPVQVDLLAGDEGSTYQLRWYALFPRTAWTNSYFSPVGDSKGGCKIYLYNPSSSSLTVTVTHANETTVEETETCTGSGRRRTCTTKTNIVSKYPAPYTVTLRGGDSEFTNVIPTGTGAALTASSPFIALSLTDTVDGGQLYDWGFPVLPSNKMTENVLVGWGYGCTGKNCKTKNRVGGDARSVVWVSPWEDADIYVDINNDGIPEPSKTVKGAKRLSSNIIENGADLSGATIWAVKPGQPFDSMQSVLIAAAWGQNSDYSFSGDDYALDLGTLVPPFIGVRVDEVIDLVSDNDGDGMISPGDVVEYTIQVQNAGQRDYGPCDYKIKDPGLPRNLPRQKYVAGSCRFISQGQQQPCVDAGLNGGDGLCSPITLPKRGGVHYYKFKAVIGSPAELDSVVISNQGNLTQTGLGPILPFSADQVVQFRPSVNIEKTVHVGALTTSCSNGREVVQGRQGDVVTYCFQVSNTGNTYLANVVVTDPENGMTPITTLSFMAPGDVRFVKFQTTIPGNSKLTNATVTGEPRLFNGNPIPTYQGRPVTDLDDAGVEPIRFVPNVSVKKYAGPQDSSCSLNKVKDDTYFAEDTKFQYCYVITNIGDECLVDLSLSDSAAGGIGTKSIPKLCPGDSAATVVGPKSSSLQSVPSTNATVTGKGERSGLAVSAKDPAAIDIPNFAPALSVKKYAGPHGSSCSINSMNDDSYFSENTKFEYCYIVSNTGNECVLDLVLSDNAVGGIGSQNIAKLCPGDSALAIKGPESSSLKDVRSTDATVTGKGQYTGRVVTAKDPVGVTVPAFAPKLSVKKYAGPQGSSCNINSMEDDAYLANNTKFEYCYVISNTGNECVVDVTLTDTAVGGISPPFTITKLCPGDSPVSRTGPESSSLQNVPSTDATVTGKGEYSGGAVSAKDPVAIRIPDFAPSVSVKKYAGPHGSGCIIDNMQDDIYVTNNTKFEYCYVMTSTGNECVVGIELTDYAVGGIGTKLVERICPGDVPAIIFGPPASTTVNVPSTDVTLSGKGEFSGIDVKANDAAAVEYSKPKVVGITIEKTVHLGDIPTCVTGQEIEYGYSGTVVTYCYKVTNTGEVALNVVVTDDPVGTSEPFSLPPNLSTFVKMPSSITADITSPGVAVGTPTDGGDSVEASDPAGVMLVPQKTACV